jgi:hypothetical protein
MRKFNKGELGIVVGRDNHAFLVEHPSGGATDEGEILHR